MPLNGRMKKMEEFLDVVVDVEAEIVVGANLVVAVEVDIRPFLIHWRLPSMATANSRFIIPYYGYYLSSRRKDGKAIINIFMTLSIGIRTPCKKSTTHPTTLQAGNQK